MAAPKLLYAAPNGQTVVRALFDQPMRQLGQSAEEDPQNPANWTTGGGLPAVVDVLRLSDVEYELLLASPAPLAAGYTVTVAGTVQAGANGTPINPGFVTAPSFTVSVADLTLDSIVWTTPASVNLIFSEPIATILFDAYNEVVQFLAQDGGREPAVIGVSQSGATLSVTLASAGTSGGQYLISLNREVFVSDATNVTLLAGDEEQLVWGQGAAPTIAAASLQEDLANITASETLGSYPDVASWPLSHGLYRVNNGSLGQSTPLELGTTTADLRAPGAAFDLGASVTFALSKTLRTVSVASSMTAQASSVVGAGNEAVGVGSVTLSKTSGNPYEVVFSGGAESLVYAGRKLSTTMAIAFTPGATSFPLAVFTLLNSQASIVIEKTVTDLAVLRIFHGNKDLGSVSKTFDPSTPFTLDIIDATGDTKGFLSVLIDGEVLLGAPASAVRDTLLLNKSAGNTAIALTLGSPLAPTETFDVVFSANLITQSYLATGFLGRTSKDLFDFGGSETTVVVAAGVAATPTTGYQNTGKAAFGVHAEYLTSVDAIQVIIGLNEEAQPLQFTGAVSLLTGEEQVVDQVLIDQTYVLVGGNELFLVFLHPICWAGALIGVSLDIGGTEYSAIAPITPLGDTTTVAQLVQQPSKWYHPRLQQSTDAVGVPGFGPSAVVLTP